MSVFPGLAKRVAILKLSLTAKTLILISIPLCFEVGSAFVLLDLQKQAEAEAREAQHARDVSDRLNRLTRDIYNLYDVITRASKGSWLSRGYVDKSYKQAAERLKGEYKAIYPMVENDSELRNSILRSVSAIDQAERLLDGLVTAIQEGRIEEVIDQNQNVHDRLTELYKTLVTQDFNLIAHYEAQYLQDSPRRQRAIRERTVAVFLIALVGNVLFSIVLSVFLVRKVTGRLALLTENFRLFGEKRALNPPLAGSDEIAELDLKFHQLAHELETAHKKERAVVDKARDTICVLSADGRFSSINPAGEKLFGVAQDKLLGASYRDYVQPSCHESMSTWFKGIKEKSFDQIEVVVNSPAKGTPTVWSAYWSAEDSSLFCVIHDISAQVELSEAKQELVAMLTHDLRTPLSTIQGCLEMLEEGRLGEINERGQRLVVLASRNGMRMKALIDDLLDIEKIKSGNMKIEPVPCKLSDVFEDVHLHLAEWLKESEISLLIKNVDYAVSADAPLLKRVLFNLVSNAIKFSPKGGKIELDCLAAGSFVEVTVKDEGPGIPEDMLSTVFERFAQVNSPEHKGKGGSGLGLTICRAIIELHGGKIWATSAAGSTFHLTLPRA